MKYAFASFGLCALLMLCALVNIFSIVLSPAKFVLIFTCAVIAGLTGLAFWDGPQVYFNKIFEK